MAGISYENVAKLAGLTVGQLQNLTRYGVIAPDIGDQRKRFSSHEARMAVVAGWCLEMQLKPMSIAKPIGWLRARTAYTQPMETDTAYWSVLAAKMSGFYSGTSATADSRNHCIDEVAYRLACIVQPGAFEPSFDHRKWVDENIRRTKSEADWLAYFEGNRNAAKVLLDQAPRWTSEEIEQNEIANGFDLACKGKRRLFLLIARAIKDDDWRAELSDEPAALAGHFGWLTIDLKALFDERPESRKIVE